MFMLNNFFLDGRKTRINGTNFSDWWTLQQLFAYPPFEEFFDTDKLISYYSEFSKGGIYQFELNVRDKIWLPVGLLSWCPMVKGDHPVSFDPKENVAYISDSITYKAYQKKGIQTILFEYTLDEMHRRGYTLVYLRTRPDSDMCYLAKKLGFKQIPNVTQKVLSMRIGNVLKADTRIFFSKQL